MTPKAPTIRKPRNPSGRGQDPAEQIFSRCLAGRVRSLSRAITAIFDEALRPLELTAGQLNTLVLIALNGPISPSKLARLQNMDKSTVSRNLKRLHNQGWVSIKTGQTARDKKLTITASGRKRIERALPLWQNAQEQAEHWLGLPGALALQIAAASALGKETP